MANTTETNHHHILHNIQLITSPNGAVHIGWVSGPNHITISCRPSRRGIHYIGTPRGVTCEACLAVGR